MSKHFSMVVRRYSDCDNPIARFVNKSRQNQNQLPFKDFIFQKRDGIPGTNHQTLVSSRFLFFWRMKQFLYVLIITWFSHAPLSLCNLYALPIVAASLFSTQEAKGQDFLPPKGNINMFQSLDNTVNAQIYNNAKTRAQRDSIIDIRLKEDWTKEIRARGPPLYPYIWVCNQSMLQLTVNSHNFGKDTYLEDHIWYNGYEGSDLEQIYTNGGTLKDMGKLGLPSYSLGLNDDITLPEGHAMNVIVTGDDVTKFENWSCIEPQGGIRVKPGEYSLPATCHSVQIYYQYLFRNDKNEKHYCSWKVLEFELIDGVAKLIYNINDDNKTIIPWASPESLNKYIHLIEKRSDILMGLQPQLLMSQVKIYPIPAKDFINIELPNSPLELQVKIYSLNGSLLQTALVKKTLNIEKLKSGLYIIEVTDGMKVYNGKFNKR
jgi:hypothetical protein